VESRRRTEKAIRQVLDGDVDAYETVIRVNELPLRSWLAGRCPPGIDETEIAHRAFVKCYHLLGTYAPGSDFRSWLFAIARNILLAECKSVRNQSEGARRYVDLAITRAQERAIEHDQSESDERVSALRLCLDELAGDARTIIEHRYTDGRRLEQIAEYVGRSVGAIKKALFKIRRKLHECIGRRLATEEVAR
jgi:RNA polymerase sigma-70 factor (ECF subfamily)